MVPLLRRINFGQTIREVGPKWHKKKNGTPTMGGFLFIMGVFLAAAVCLPLYYGQPSQILLCAASRSPRRWAAC